jgi:hypothetical protein
MSTCPENGKYIYVLCVELHKGKTNGSILLHFAFVTGEYKLLQVAEGLNFIFIFCKAHTEYVAKNKRPIQSRYMGIKEIPLL